VDVVVDDAHAVLGGWVVGKNDRWRKVEELLAVFGKMVVGCGSFRCGGVDGYISSIGGFCS
jgi:hypothetical protein